MMYQLKQLIFLLILLFFTIPSYATTYYLANNGNNANIGTNENAAWQTINQLNQAFKDKMIQAGDNILFKRGDIFYGQIYSSAKAEENKRITFGAYGNPIDHKPIISGMLPINGWAKGTANGISVCQTNLSSLPEIAETDKHNSFSVSDMIAGKIQTLPQYLFFDGKLQVLARYPNHGFMFVDDNTSKKSKTIKDTELANVPKPNEWTGGNIILRTTNWTYGKNDIKKISKNSLTSSNILVGSGGLAINNGYFLQGKLAGLDVSNEWYADDSTMYFIPPKGISCSSLNTNRIKVSVFETAFQLGDYFTVQNLHMEGYSQKAIKTSHQKQYIKIDSCTITNSLVGIAGTDNGNITITNNTLMNVFNNGISFWPITNSVISGNVLENIGLQPEVGGPFVGIRIGSNEPKKVVKNVISYNQLRNIGYSGIMFRAGDGSEKNANVIEKNIVEHTLAILADGGSIYMQTSSGVIVRDNILIDAIGNKESWDNGIGHKDYTSYAFGIAFYGENSKNQLINNTITNHNEAFHSSGNDADIKLIGNTFYNNSLYQAKLAMTKNVSGSLKYTVKDNIFYANDPFAWVMRQNANNKGNWNYGTFNNNYYCNPYSFNRYVGNYVSEEASKSSNSIIWRWQNTVPYNTYLDLESHQNVSKQDFNTKTDLEKWTVFRIGNELYEVQDKLSSNYITNPTFDSDTNPWEIAAGVVTVEKKSGMQGKALRVQSTTKEHRTRLNNGVTIPFEKDQYYLFQFTIMSDEYTSVQVDYKEKVNVHSSKGFGDEMTFPVSPEKKTHSYIFQTDELKGDMRMFFYTPKKTPDYWIDDLSLFKVSLKKAIKPTERSKIFINPTINEDIFSLRGITYQDLDGKTVQGNIKLKPFSSQILVYKSGIVPPLSVPHLSINKNIGSSDPWKTITASWNAVSGATGYMLYYAPPGGDGQPDVNQIGTINMGSQNGFSVELSPGLALFVAVKAYGDKVESDYSNIGYFTTP
ncbi:right-handed parallel beta-helix repeat-containing protein [Candidatus Halobeggiatoa sp. HSG11]|nr:right-handed parallel beta-helix repeat-containing protein [Candidatus Halobeggiatoa sp. HSG11]